MYFTGSRIADRQGYVQVDALGKGEIGMQENWLLIVLGLAGLVAVGRYNLRPACPVLRRGAEPYGYRKE